MMFKKASKLRLRIDTNLGPLAPEQLWDLSITDLDKMAVELESQYENSSGKSFLDETRKKDEVAKLKFDIVHAILKDKVAERDAMANEGAKKAHNEKIDALIKRKKDDEMSEMSIEELEALRQ